VPDKAIREIHAAVSRTAVDAVKAGLFDTFELWDTNGKNPVKIAEAVGTELKIHDRKAWDKFVAKGKEA
jgi:hypothetical protein